MSQRQTLLTYEHKQAIIDAVKEYSVLVIAGEAGSGKTTQIPQYILEEMPELDKIGVTQTKHKAAVTAATRVSEEQNTELGTVVGYTIRGEDRTNSSTRLKYLTDGALLREATLDPLFKSYSAVVIDQAHERTQETEDLLELLKKAHVTRPELKILIISDTLDATARLTEFFNDCTIFTIPGKN
ncbi:hypothetical protein K7432_011669 [Basidiobolus ranarum]|uniref:Helicase ATP-binding domain-containing protein n=1 Tax=Basidiobolus ranarum TaxID=34480 RepID=A0ABR2WM06_9FUNG